MEEIVTYLLDRGANASVQDAFGTTPLCEAVKRGRMGVVRILIEADAELALKVRACSRTVHLPHYLSRCIDNYGSDLYPFHTVSQFRTNTDG